MFRTILVVVLTVAIVLGSGWFVMRRDDIPYDRLEGFYANPESSFIVLDNGLRVHYRDVGPRNAPVVVLVHGFSASLHTWKDWTTDLQSSYRVISLDLPGHGLTRCLESGEIGVDQFIDTVDEVTQALGVDRFSLVGSSMGGHMAWNFALAHPERLTALVLVDASGWPKNAGEGKNAPLVFKLLANPLARRVIRDLDMTSLIRSGLEDSFSDPSLVTDSMVDRYAALSRAPCHRDAIMALSTRTDERPLASADLLSKIATPTLVMQGEEDNLVPAEHARKFAAAIPGAELKLYSDVGHLPQEELAEQSAADLKTFLTSVLDQRENELTVGVDASGQ